MGDQYKPVVFYCGTVKPRLLVVSRFFFVKLLHARGVLKSR